MSSFSQEQVRHFRQVFSQFSDEERGGVTQENFVAAVQGSLEQCNLPNQPTPVYLAGEFGRLAGDGGIVTWQQFFQVLIHINLSFGHGSAPPDNAEPPVSQSQSRVQFDTRVEVNEPSAPPGPDQRTGTLGRTLRHRAGQFGHAVGNFFGLTDESQHGNANRIGWEEFTERRAVEESSGLISTLGRRVSLSRRPSQRGQGYSEEPPPDYVAISDGRSFNLTELGDDSSEEDTFITEAPPSYFDATTPFAGATDQQDPWAQAPTEPALTRVHAEEQQYPTPTYPSAQPQRTQPQPTPAPVSVPRDELIHDKNQAWEYYTKFVKAEKRIRQRRHRDDAIEFFGSTDLVGGDTEHAVGVRRERLQSIDQSTPEVQRRKKKKKKKPTKLQRQSTLIRREVESLPSFIPWFIILVSVAQVITIIVLLPLYGIAPIKIIPIENTEVFPSLSTENTTANVTYYRSVNLWIGPTPTNLIFFGAKFTPCMRTDFGIRNRNARQYGDRNAFSCCQNQQWVGVFNTTQCIRSDASDVNINSVGECSDNSSVYVPNFRPCCISITGACRVVSFEECEARNGWYHGDALNCDEVNCLRNVCGFNEVGIGGDGLLPTAQQFWRWFTSIFIHLGVIHLIFVIPVQLYIGIKIERTIGWLRVGIIYLLSGVGGNLISAIFVPYGVNAGASGAVFGLLGVLFVELGHFWQIIDHPFLELLKLTAFVVFLLALGTLPYVDNMAHIGGLLFGIPSALVFVPYITFGKWDAARKRILLIICIPLLIVLFLAGFLTFYLIPDPTFCFFCHYINCVPYSSGICPDDYSNPDAQVFSL